MYIVFTLMLSDIIVITILYLAQYHLKEQLSVWRRQWWFKFAFVALILTIVLGCIDIHYNYFGQDPSLSDGVSNILAELHGFLFDLILVTIIMEFLSKKEQKKETQAELEQELEDYQHFDAEDITIRKIRILKQLIRIGKQEINLSNHIFNKAIFDPDSYDSVLFSKAKFNASVFRRTVFTQNQFQRSRFDKASLTNVHFRGCDLHSAKFSGCTFSSCTFEDCDLSFSEFNECRFIDTRFKDSNLEEGSLKQSTFWAITLEGSKLENIELDELLFVDLRRESLTLKLEMWLGKEQAQTWIFENHHISNLDDPLLPELTLLPNWDSTSWKKKENGCVLRKVPPGIVKLDES